MCVCGRSDGIWLAVLSSPKGVTLGSCPINKNGCVRNERKARERLKLILAPLLDHFTNPLPSTGASDTLLHVIFTSPAGIIRN